MASAAGKSVMGISKMLDDDPLTKKAMEDLKEYARQQLADFEKVRPSLLTCWR
jgi:exopolyphosphatase/pppGpp-phosphohydrolase